MLTSVQKTKNKKNIIVTTFKIFPTVKQVQSVYRLHNRNENRTVFQLDLKYLC